MTVAFHWQHYLPIPHNHSTRVQHWLPHPVFDLSHKEHAGEISERIGIDKRCVYWVREKLRRHFGAKINEYLIQRAAAEGFIYPHD